VKDKIRLAERMGLAAEAGWDIMDCLAVIPDGGIAWWLRRYGVTTLHGDRNELFVYEQLDIRKT
jgi:hypothetical protein